MSDETRDRAITILPDDMGAEAWPANDLECVQSCPACGSAYRMPLHESLVDRVFFCAPGTWTMYRCCGCGAAYLDPRPTAGSIGRAYSSYFTHSGRETIASRDLSTLRKLRRTLANGFRNTRFGTNLRPASRLGAPVAYLLPGLRRALSVGYRCIPKAHSGATLLDIGAGNGDFLALVRDAGWKVEGIEPDPSAVAVCEGRGLSVRVGGIETYDGADECFDYITISHVIEHVHDPRHVLRRAYQLLRVGGSIYVDTPNIDAYGHGRFGRNWRGLEPPRHLTLFNWGAMDSALRAAGFTACHRVPQYGLYASIAARSRAIAMNEPCPTVRRRFSDVLRERLGLHRLLHGYKDTEFVTFVAKKQGHAA